MSIGVLLRGFIGDMMDFGDVILRTLFPSFMTIQACSDECRGGSGESDQVDKWCSVVTTGTKPTLTKEQPITDRYTDRIRTTAVQL